MDRRNTGLIAGLGCGALLLLVVLPIALIIWAFSGGLNLGLPNLGGNPDTTERQPVPDDRSSQATVTRVEPRSQATQTIPETGNQEVGNMAEPVIQAPESLADLYDQVSPGTVSILVAASGAGAFGQQGGGAGSGFVLTDDGYIVTNDHVVEGGDTFIVRFFNDVDVRAEVVGADPDSDLAILKVEQLPEGALPLPLGDSDAIRVGDGVVAIGNPFAIGTSMSYGIISAVGRTIPSLSQYNIPKAIQTDAAINPGNSGGPLINMRGEVIGVNAQIRTAGQGGGNVGIGFAIPVNIVKMVYPSLIQQGSYQWAYLGVSTPNISPFAFEEGQQAPRGAYIGEVTPGGPADQAGIRSGDIVVRANDEVIDSFDDLLTIVAFQPPGTQLQLTVLRDGQEQQVTVTLGERPEGTLQ